MVLDAFKVYLPISHSSYLSDIHWSYFQNGYGPVEFDKSNGEDDYNDGHTLTLNGVTYAKGSGVHAYSKVKYDLNGKYSRFQSYIGLDDEVGSGSVEFKVYGDGVLLYSSGSMGAGSQTKFVDVDVRDVGLLVLVVEDLGGNGRTVKAGL